MGKQLQRGGYGVQLQEHHPGCFWGMFHVLDYHHWHHIKRLLHHKKHHGRRRPRCCAAPKTISFNYDAREDHVDVESQLLLGDSHDERGTSLEYGPSKELSTEEVDKNWVLGFPKTEHQQKHARGISDGARPIIIFHDRSSDPDAEVKEEMFRQISQYPYNGLGQHSSGEHPSSRNAKFTKARSFPIPLADSSGNRRYRPSTLDHKQNEVWLFPKGERRTIITIDSPKDKEMNFVPLNGSIKNSSMKLNNHGWNQLIINQFKGFKKIIKRALKEGRKENSSCEETKEVSASSQFQEEGNDNISCGDIKESNLQRMARFSSLNESMDRYTRLFVESFGGDASKLHNSKSLKLTDEDNKIGGHVPKSFVRRLSLPDSDALYALLGDMSQENLYSGLLSGTKPETEKSMELKSLQTSGDINRGQPVESASKIDFVDNPVEGSRVDLDTELEVKSFSVGDRIDHDETVVQSTQIEHGAFHDQNIVTLKAKIELQPSSPVSVLRSFLPENKTEPKAASSLEESTSCSTSDFVDLIKDGWKLVKEDEPDLNFVKDILKLAGFFENEFIQSWDSIELPLNPKLFDELEASEIHELECSDGCCTHQLLFDLINEALLEIYERSVTYFPKPFSFSPYTRPITKGEHVLDEVWKRVKGYKSMEPQLDLSLDDIVARDMAKQDGWMSLGWDNECVALELEDFIFNEVMDELICS